MCIGINWSVTITVLTSLFASSSWHMYWLIERIFTRSWKNCGDERYRKCR
jgi:hypothetical protein